MIVYYNHKIFQLISRSAMQLPILIILLLTAIGFFITEHICEVFRTVESLRCYITPQ